MTAETLFGAGSGRAAAETPGADWSILGGLALVDGALVEADIHCVGGAIAGAPARDARRYDARGRLVLPGIVDIHGDGFERQVQPRPRVAFPLDVALRETDRQCLANGITTAFHGLTLSWEPGLRSLEAGRRFVEALDAERPRLGCDTRLHLRWETFALEAEADVAAWLRRDPTPILAFNDHTTTTVRSERPAHKLQGDADRAGVTPDAYRALLAEAWARREETPDAIARLAAAARAAGATLLAHDERSPEERLWFRALGAVASEFPMTLETAAAARAAGEHAILGAPNVLRGGSHNGALDATEAVAAGLCSVLASDYYYPAPLLAAFRLARDGVVPLAAAWALVSANAAAAAGLRDRGALVEGLRGDVVVVDARDAAAPRAEAVFVAGRKVFEAAAG